MPSGIHEVLIDLFRQRPQLAVELLPRLGIDRLPEFDSARTESGDFPDIVPTEYRADGVVVLMKGTKVVLAVVVEVQLRPDDKKEWVWPVYVVTLRARLRCPVVLLVVCPSRGTALECARPIEIGPGSILTPTVLGPEQVPLISDPESPDAADIDQVALSAVMHRAARDWKVVLPVLLERAQTMEDPSLYIDLVMKALSKAGKTYLEGLMSSGTYAPKSEWGRRLFDEGKAEGEGQALLTFLKARGFAVSDAVMKRITACTDPEQLNVWVARAASATTLDQVFSKA